MLFSCAALRSLTLACCRFALPATVSLPSVETLLLSHVNGPDSDVQRLVSGCPRLADLSIVACRALTAVTVLGARLRRLAILCSDSLAAVAVDASELRHFEYSGFVPDGRNFLTLHGDAQRRRGMAYCKVNICGAEATSEYKLTHLRQFLQLSRRESQDCPEELLSGQQLRYNPHGRGLAAAPQAPCLRSTVRELSLVHYQGGVAQRSLARFVLRSAPAIAEVYCGCAEGDWSTLSQLKREIIGWVMNKSANTIFA
uniref:F-box/LRR-repeat protein 15/At3g58940/PEG3-like LRR domain-containing protein n=1 Tax=Oryza brachyantha TaxID=4533 RepID=J3N9U3_ORYBR